MTNEIKEILDNIKNKYEDYYVQDIVSGKDLKLLLDYITNLQEENERLKELKYKFFDCSGDEESFTLNDYLELGNKLYDLQEEKQRLLESADCLSKGYSDLEKRIDKAVEYIINHTQSTAHLEMDTKSIKQLLDILRGDE